MDEDFAKEDWYHLRNRAYAKPSSQNTNWQGSGGGILKDHTSRGALGWGLSPQLLPLMGVIFFFLIRHLLLLHVYLEWHGFFTSLAAARIFTSLVLFFS